MPPLIDTGVRTPIRFVTPFTPVGFPEGTFRLGEQLERNAPLLQRQAELKARVEQQEAERRQRQSLAIQRQVGDAFSDFRRFGANQALAESDFQNRQALAEGVEQRQIALEQLRQEGRQQAAGDKFAKDYGFVDMNAMQLRARQEGHTLENFTRILNGEVLGIPPGNIEKIRAIDDAMQAVNNDPVLEDDPETKQRLIGDLQGKRFELGRPRLHHPVEKPRTFQQMIGNGTATQTPDGGFIFQSGVDSNGRPEFKHVKPPKAQDAEQEPIRLDDFTVPEDVDLDREKIGNMRRGIATELRREFATRTGESNAANVRIGEKAIDKILQRRIEEMFPKEIAEAKAKRKAATGRVTEFLAAMNKKPAPLTRDQLRTGPRATNDLKQKIGTLMAKVKRLELNDPRRKPLLDELEKLVRSADAGN